MTSNAPKWDFAHCDKRERIMVAKAPKQTVAKTLIYKYLTQNYIE